MKNYSTQKYWSNVFGDQVLLDSTRTRIFPTRPSPIPHKSKYHVSHNSFNYFYDHQNRSSPFLDTIFKPFFPPNQNTLLPFIFIRILASHTIDLCSRPGWMHLKEPKMPKRLVVEQAPWRSQARRLPLPQVQHYVPSNNPGPLKPCAVKPRRSASSESGLAEFTSSDGASRPPRGFTTHGLAGVIML